MTLDKIAKSLGLTKGTVSRVISGKAAQSRISQQTIDRVREFCAKVNYLPNIHASRMQAKIVRNIMIVFHSEHNGLYDNKCFTDYNMALILGGISQIALEEGYTFTMGFYNSGTTLEELLAPFRRKEIDGMIYYGVDFPEEWLEAMRAEHTHFVGIGIEPAPDIPTVNINNREMSMQLTRELLAKGRRRFLYLASSNLSFVGKERRHGFQEVMKEAGISDYRILYSDFSQEKAYEQVKRLLQQGEFDFDAVMAANDQKALGAISALREAGYSIPEEVSVAGADNIQLCTYVTPALSTFDNCADRLGRHAARKLLDLINGIPVSNEVIKSSLFLRDSI
ncbi:MAG: LacI family DNA-binding transcriptional regulator [Victivallales bacterium]|nr:LacI family DNA-binding transcriptional regulator [Victivallales bacterium]